MSINVKFKQDTSETNMSIKLIKLDPGIVVPACNSSTQEVEAGRP
jgi:hypothetical protein